MKCWMAMAQNGQGARDECRLQSGGMAAVKDLQVVRVALTLPSNSGSVEGNVTELQLIKRHSGISGRAHLDFPRSARLVRADSVVLV